MLESITLKGFQQHEYIKVDFHPRKTIICGPSRAGKTTILRALRWVCLNRPTPASLIQHGKDSCEVRLRFDGHLLIRRKSPTENVYILDGKKFSAVGLAVPQEIANLLNISDINFQRQLDPPFWLLDPAPTVSKNLNSIVNLTDIDTALSNAGAVVRTAKTALSLCEGRIIESEQERDKLEWVPRLVKKHQQVEAAWTRILARRERLRSLTLLLQQAKEYQTAVKSAKERTHGLEELLLQTSRILTRRQQLEGLRRIVQQIKKAEEDSWQALQRVKDLEKERKALLATFKTCPLCERPMKLSG